MKHRAVSIICIVVVTAAFSSAQTSQVSTGLTPFGSFGGGPFDTVNLGNLNVHLAIPILHKAGRGLPFNYDLGYDSSVWQPVTSSGTTQWQPVFNWGWRAQTEMTAGYVTFNASVAPCIISGHSINRTLYQDWAYHDPRGVVHPFPNMFLSSETIQGGSCGPASATSTTTDGSGYSMTATYTSSSNTVSAIVFPKSGGSLTPPLQIGTGSANFTDANGNEITVNTSGQFFDTLSSTTPVLTVTGTGTASSPTSFTYLAPSGANASYTVNYTQYTVATSFGVSGISEYGPLANPLVSSVVLPDDTSSKPDRYTFTYEKTPGSCTPLSGTFATNCITGRIASVALPTGGTITYTYTGGSNGIESDGSTAGLTRMLSPTTTCASTSPTGCWQYSRTLVTGTPAPGSTWTTTVVDPAGNNTIINFTEDGNKAALPYNFYETQRQVYQGSVSASNLLWTSISCYSATFTNCPTGTVLSPISQTDLYSQLPNGKTRLSETVYNNVGVVTDDKEYDYGVTVGAAPTVNPVRETVTTYGSFNGSGCTALSNNIVSLPCQVIVKDWTSGSAVTLSSTSYTYDQGTVTATSGTPQHVGGSSGNLTTLTVSTTSSASLTKTFTYYDTGTPFVTTDVNGKTTTTYTYSTATQGPTTASCGNSFPTSAVTAGTGVSMSRSTVWNCNGGVATQITDVNGNNVTSSYTDANFWRPASVTDQLTNQTNVGYIGETAVEAALQNFNSGNSASDSRTTVDGFGRPILNQRLQGPSATTYDTAETDYNNLGQPVRTTMPFSAAAGGTSSTAPAATKTYDALGRVLTVKDANGGTVSFTYTNNDVLQQASGTQTFKKQFEYDGLGRLTSVCEISSTLPGVGTCGQSTTPTQTGYWTKYTYDALGHLLTVTQNAQASSGTQARAFTYDMAGRMLTESNPETGNGGVNGKITYIYDSVSSCGGKTSVSFPGDLVEKQDNAGNVTCYTYDGLHRILTAGNSTISGATLRNFVYDTKASFPSGVGVSNGMSHMIEAQTTNAAGTTVLTDEYFSYDARGELTDVYEMTPHSSGFYHTTAAYWPTGTLKTLSGIPGVPTINYGASGAGLDGEGRVTKVTAGASNLVSSVTYSTSSTTNPLGTLTNVVFGSADSDSFTYDSNTGRMASYTFSVNGKNDVGTLTWNTNGTLGKLVVADAISGTADSQTCTYGYDDLQRASNVTCGTLWAQNLTYDAFGNISKNVPSGDGGLSFLPSYWTSPPTNQFNSLPGVTVKYDANGNLLTDNLNTYTWDPNWGTMTTVSTGSTTVTATYDALGRTVEQQNGSAFTEILYSPAGKTALMSGTTLTKAFIALPGGAKAIYNSTGLVYYRHSDWLGSSRLASTPSRTLFSSTAYAPFGEQYATTGTADPSYTGQNSDTVSSLYDFLFRRQSMSQGRWISPDPSGMAAARPANPQSWNRYAYVLNNPMALTDPLGLDDCPYTACVTAPAPPPVPTSPVGLDPALWDFFLGPEGYNSTDEASRGGWNENQHEACKHNQRLASCAAETTTQQQSRDGGRSASEALAAAIQTTLAILSSQNPCAGYFDQGSANFSRDGSGSSAAGMFQQVTVQGVSNQTFTSVAGTTTQGTGADSTISINYNSPFMLPVQGTTIYRVGPFISATPGAQVIEMMHEFAHNLNMIPPDGSNVDQSHENTNTIITNCGSTVSSN